MVKIKLTFLMMCLFTLPAAAGSLANLYQQKTKQVLTSMQILDIQKVACTRVSNFTDCFNPAVLKRKIDQVKWVELEYFYKGSMASRWGAFYSPTENTIYLNKSVPHDPEYIGYVGLHEILGVMGRPEKDFSISIAAYKAVTLFGPDRETEEPEWRLGDFKASIMIFPDWALLQSDVVDNQRLMVSANSGGGVFVGGGGGDTRTLQLRLAVFKQLQKYIKRVEALDVTFATIRIEILNSDQTEILYEVRGGFMVGQILVPEGLLRQMSTRDPKVPFPVEDIAWFLASANPSIAGVPTKGPLAFIEPLTVDDFHPVAKAKMWCTYNIFGRAPVPACTDPDPIKNDWR